MSGRRGSPLPNTDRKLANSPENLKIITREALPSVELWLRVQYTLADLTVVCQVHRWGLLTVADDRVRPRPSNGKLFPGQVSIEAPAPLIRSFKFATYGTGTVHCTVAVPMPTRSRARDKQ